MKSYALLVLLTILLHTVGAQQLRTPHIPINRDSALLAKAKIPPRNDRLLATIPKKRLDSAQLKAWLIDFSKKISPTLSAGGAQHNNSNAAADPTGTSAVLTLLQGDELSAIQQALDIAISSPDNLQGLSNLGGILIAVDMPSRAIPILEHVDSVMPGNSTVENNLGQAYIALGDDKKAETYLQQAVSQSEHHPMANRTLAYIFLSRHDKPTALEYLKKSLMGGFTNEAWAMLKNIESTDPEKKDHINRQTKLMDLIIHRYTRQETFNFKDYMIPPQCRKVEDVVELQMVYDAYNDMLNEQLKKYEKLAEAEKTYNEANGQALAAQAKKLAAQLDPGKMTMDQMLQNARTLSAGVQNMVSKMPGKRPCGPLAEALLIDLNIHYIDDIRLMDKRDSSMADSINQYLTEYDTICAQVERKYKPREDKFGEGNPDITIGSDRCNEINESANTYMGRIADLVEARINDRMEKEKTYFNDFNYWSYLASSDDHQYKEMFYHKVTDILHTMRHLANTHFLYCFSHSEDDSSRPEAHEISFKELVCPFLKTDKEFKNVDAHGEEHTLGKISANCDKFKISASGGKSSGDVGFEASKDFSTGDCILSLTAGLGTKKSIAIFKDALDAGSSLTPSIVLGGPGRLNDITLKYEIHVKIFGQENSADYTLSYQNGWIFHGKGPIIEKLSRWGEDVLGVPHAAPQMNKKVQLYQDTHPNGQ